MWCQKFEIEEINDIIEYQNISFCDDYYTIVIKSDLDEKEEQLNQFIKQIGLDQVRDKYTKLKKQVDTFDLYKGIKCTHPYEFDNSHRYVVSYGFDTEYCHTCPLCGKKYNY
jgi:hypothetical protein